MDRREPAGPQQVRGPTCCQVPTPGVQEVPRCPEGPEMHQVCLGRAVCAGAELARAVLSSEEGVLSHVSGGVCWSDPSH